MYVSKFRQTRLYFTCIMFSNLPTPVCRHLMATDNVNSLSSLAISSYPRAMRSDFKGTSHSVVLHLSLSLARYILFPRSSPRRRSTTQHDNDTGKTRAPCSCHQRVGSLCVLRFPLEVDFCSSGTYRFQRRSRGAGGGATFFIKIRPIEQGGVHARHLEV